MIPLWLLSRVPFLGKVPWKLAGAIFAILAMSVLAWRIAAWREGYLARDAAIEQRDKARKELATLQASVNTANARNAELDAAYQRTTGQRDAYAAQVSALLNRPPIDPKTLIVKVPDASGIACPDRSTDFRLRYNEIASTGDR